MNMNMETLQRVFDKLIRSGGRTIIHGERAYQFTAKTFMRGITVKRFYYQVYFNEQEGRITDTVEFVVPEGIKESDIASAIDVSMNLHDQDEYEDRLEYADDVFLAAARHLGGTWHYINIVGLLEVE